MDTSIDELKLPLAELGALIDERVSTGQAVSLTVAGDSMNPMLISGRDSVTLTAVKKLKKGQVVFYKSGDAYLLHRIIRIKGDAVSCMGDNGAVLEPPVTRGDVIAVVTEFIRNSKRYSVKNLKYRLYAFMWRKFIKKRPRMLKIAAHKTNGKGK